MGLGITFAATPDGEGLNWLDAGSLAAGSLAEGGWLDAITEEGVPLPASCEPD